MSIELMSPAGNLEGARLAIKNGADSIYAGITNLSLRPKRVEFSETSFSELADYVHGQNKKIYGVLNIQLKPEDRKNFETCLKDVSENKVDGVIVTDISAIRYIHKHKPDLPIHVSIQASVANPEAARFYQDLGASVVVISRSLDDLNEIRRIREAVDIDLEVFIHGGLCFMYDGNCFMSSYWKQEWAFDEDLGIPRLYGQNNTKGECHLICKCNCSLVVEEELVAEGRLLRRPDIVGLKNLPFYIDIGLKILKIEGRAMPLRYVAEATRLYREAIDIYLNDPERYYLKTEWAAAVERLLQARLEYEQKWHIR